MKRTRRENCLRRLSSVAIASLVLLASPGTARALVDCNGNGIDDAIELAGQIDFAPPVDYGTEDYPTRVVVADLDGDGDLDAIVSNEFSGSVSIFWNAGNGQFPLRTDIPVGNSPAGIGVGDLDGDGFVDLAVAVRSANAVAVLINDGTGGFPAQVNYAVNEPVGVAVADLNGDGCPDLAVTAHLEQTVWVLLNDCDGTFDDAAPTPWAVGDHPGEIAAADFDADGDMDLAVSNHYDSSVSVLLNDGGDFSRRMDYTVADGPAVIVADDLDDDGDIDIAVSCQSSLVSVLLNEGDGTFLPDPATNWPTGNFSTGMTGADLDCDGDPDLATANYFGHNVSVLRNAGDATFDPNNTTYFPAGDGAYFIASADLDGDGDDDLIVTNVLADTISVLMNITIEGPDCNGNGILDECDIADGTSADCNGNGIPDECDLPGDINGDGHVDLADLAILLANYRSSVYGSPCTP